MAELVVFVTRACIEGIIIIATEEPFTSLEACFGVVVIIFVKLLSETLN